MKCKVTKKAYCPLKRGYIIPGETIEVPEKFIKGYSAYVLPIESSKKEPKKKTTKKSGDE